MLVLSRRVGESVVIGNQVTVTVLEVRGDQIRVGIDAPREVQVHRAEVFDALQAENNRAAGNADRARRLVARMPRTARTPGTAAGRGAAEGQPGGDAATGRSQPPT